MGYMLVVIYKLPVYSQLKEASSNMMGYRLVVIYKLSVYSQLKEALPYKKSYKFTLTTLCF